jgi:hypothetical protein
LRRLWRVISEMPCQLMIRATRRRPTSVPCSFSSRVICSAP